MVAAHRGARPAVAVVAVAGGVRVIFVGVLVLLALYLVVRNRARRHRRDDSTDVLSQLLDLHAPYRGRKWKVGDRWWL